ncbi:MAG: RDD family protein [Nonlabens sp.]|uniref:RDD family protein n=1 Tax=Nonlabens sp. TaxID=1888209 RepID=UPI003EF9A2BC
MSNTNVNTAQNVNINYNVSSLGHRIVALLIDLVIMGLYQTIINYIGLGFESMVNDNTFFGVSQFLLLPIAFYSLFFNIVFGGRTPGKFIMKMKVVKIDGSPARWSDYLVSWLLRPIDIWFTSGSVGIMSIIFTEKKQRLGDSASDTIVIDARKKTKISHTILEDVDEHYEPTFLMVNNLSDNDVNEIKEIYRLAAESRDFKALNQLRDKVEELLHIKSELRDGIFIRTVLKDYTYLTQGH